MEARSYAGVRNRLSKLNLGVKDLSNHVEAGFLRIVGVNLIVFSNANDYKTLG